MCQQLSPNMAKLISIINFTPYSPFVFFRDARNPKKGGALQSSFCLALTIFAPNSVTSHNPYKPKNTPLYRAIIPTLASSRSSIKVTVHLLAPLFKHSRSEKPSSKWRLQQVLWITLLALRTSKNFSPDRISTQLRFHRPTLISMSSTLAHPLLTLILLGK